MLVLEVKAAFTVVRRGLLCARDACAVGGIGEKSVIPLCSSRFSRYTAPSAPIRHHVTMVESKVYVTSTETRALMVSLSSAYQPDSGGSGIAIHLERYSIQLYPIDGKAN